MAATLTADAELTYASFPIEKIEQTPDGDVLVWGKATDGSVDSDQQIVDPEFAAKAIQDWLDTGPNVRVQHQAQRDPAGVGVMAEKDGDAQWVKSLVVEPVAKRLVLAKALRAYSVGIAHPTIVRDPVARGGRITDGQIVEISLVDRPANKNCGIQLVKAAKDGTAEWVGKVFGYDEVLTKAATVDITLPADVQVSFSPADLAKISTLAQRNSSFVAKDVTTVSAGGVPPASVPKEVTTVSAGGVPAGSMPKEDDEAEVEKAEYEASFTGKRKLTTEARNALPSSSFVFPDKRKYPIHDKSHARNALSRASGKPEEATVRAAVARRYPGLGKKDAAKAAASVAQEAVPDMTKPVRKGDDSEDKEKYACIGCGAMQNKQHAFCSECGKNMAGAVPVSKNHDFMCLGCGYKLDKGERFCPGCGKSNPGHNPMADLKIPANKAADPTERSRVATEPDGSAAAMATDTIEKAKGDRKATKPGQMPGEDSDTYTSRKKPKRTGDRIASKPGQEPGEDAGDYRAGKKGKKNKCDDPMPNAGPASNAIDIPTETPVAKGKMKVKIKPDMDDDDDAAKVNDAALTRGPATKGKKNKPTKGPATGKTPARGAVARGNLKTVPKPRDGSPEEVFDRDASREPMAAKFDADPMGTTALRLKSIGLSEDMGFAHDLTCPAFDWSMVSKAYPTGLSDLSADAWQQKALEAASSAPLAEAQAASKLGQAVFTIKSAGMADLIDVKNDLYKAFRDANPGPGSFPTPGDINATRFQRPRITSGMAAYSRQYEGPNSAHVPTSSLAASSYTRDYLTSGTADESPANKGQGAPYPSDTGVLSNLDYSSIHKANVLQAYKSMHDHFDRVFPGVCPMNNPTPGAPSAHPLGAVKVDDAVDVTKDISPDGMSKGQRKRLQKKLTKKVMSGKMPLDQARIRMGKKPKTAPEPLKPQKSAAAPEITKTSVSLSQSDIAKAFAAELRKAARKSDKKIAVLTKAVNSLADQPDPSTQAFKGMALNPLRTKSAGPAGVQTTAEIAERTQVMMLHELENQFRTSTDPAQREAAWKTIMKMRGLPDGS